MISDLKKFYDSGHTKPLAYRMQQLQGIKRFLTECEDDITNSLYQDLRKPPIESYITEIAMMMSELQYTIKHLPNWIKPKRVSTLLALQPGKSRIYSEPLGVVLIMAPWNYPISLTIIPLIGALAAGNCVVIKPSELASATSHLLTTKLLEYVDPNSIKIVEGGVPEATSLLNEKFDHIFFTGSTIVGRKVMEAAAKQLIPVTLELGGKSPCLVDQTANLDVAARRIAWAKFTNAGQTCVAPDYVLVHESVERILLEKLQEACKHFYGDQPKTSPDYGRIINSQQCKRLIKLLTENGDIAMGGNYDENENYISPTILRNVPLFSPIMQEEIFGPVLPLIRYHHIDDAIRFLTERPKPLAAYLFTQTEKTKNKFIEQVSAGTMCINHAMQQLAVPGLPFGGVGASGMGAYHGKASFDNFTHYKSVFEKYTFWDPNFLYPPYKEKLKAFLRWLI